MKIKLGIIGVGAKGIRHLRILLNSKDVEVPVICEIDKENTEKALITYKELKKKKPTVYSDAENGYKKLLEHSEIDGVVIATPWELNTKIAIDAMKAGKYVGIEVPAAQTIEECEQLIKVYEETESPLMLLENACYLREVMAVYNMVQLGVFGELVTCNCGYQHDLRDIIFQKTENELQFGNKAKGEAKWRTEHYLNRNADIYPTHGIGPVSLFLNINRGNRFTRLSSFATKSIGLHSFIKKFTPPNHKYRKLNFRHSDVITTMLETSNGETVIVNYDTCLPRPYSLNFKVQGANGIWLADSNSIYIEGESPEHTWENADKYLKKYDHKLWKTYGKTALNLLNEKARDFFVLHDFVAAIKQKRNTPFDVYDAVTWSSLTPLSEKSIKENTSVEFPDFTKGKWKKRSTWDNYALT